MEFPNRIPAETFILCPALADTMKCHQQAVNALSVAEQHLKTCKGRLGEPEAVENRSPEHAPGAVRSGDAPGAAARGPLRGAHAIAERKPLRLAGRPCIYQACLRVLPPVRSRNEEKG